MDEFERLKALEAELVLARQQLERQDNDNQPSTSGT